MPKAEIVKVIRGYLEAQNVVTDTPAVRAGLEAMEAGADFADGVVAYEGRWMGGEMFVSFDKKAVAAVAKQGLQAELLG
jgi:predicted nucleic-acid-binding protein